jgi:hypothetical protein
MSVLSLESLQLVEAGIPACFLSVPDKANGVQLLAMVSWQCIALDSQVRYEFTKYPVLGISLWYKTVPVLLLLIQVPGVLGRYPTVPVLSFLVLNHLPKNSIPSRIDGIIRQRSQCKTNRLELLQAILVAFPQQLTIRQFSPLGSHPMAQWLLVLHGDVLNRDQTVFVLGLIFWQQLEHGISPLVLRPGRFPHLPNKANVSSSRAFRRAFDSFQCPVVPIIRWVGTQCPNFVLSAQHS